MRVMTRKVNDADLLAAAAFQNGKTPDAVEAVSQGFSGGQVLRCRWGAQTFALKRWPASTTENRVDEVHRVQTLSRQTLAIIPRLVALPSGERRLSAFGHHFELSSWMPGEPVDAPTQPNPACQTLAGSLSLGAAAIARFHRSVEILGVKMEIAPAVVRRWQRLAELKTLLPEALNAYSKGQSPERVRASVPLLQAVNHCVLEGGRLQSDAERWLRPWLDRPVETQWVLADVHREHVLFEGGQVEGIVDFDAVRRDTVATDLARWVGSFLIDGNATAALWAAAIGSYRTLRSLSPCEQELAGAIEKASWFIQLANWVVWNANAENDFPGGITAVERRVAFLMRRSRENYVNE